MTADPWDNPYWAAVNVLGGTVEPGDIRGQGYVAAIDDALAAIEKLPDTFVRRPVYGDWRDIRTALETIDPGFMQLPKNEQRELWQHAEAFIRAYTPYQPNCVECRKLTRWDEVYRCADCRMICCEGCIRRHFGPAHQPHPPRSDGPDGGIAATAPEAQHDPLIPDLMEALQRLDAVLDFGEPGSDDKPMIFEDWSELNAAFDDARAALAKAKAQGHQS